MVKRNGLVLVPWDLYTDDNPPMPDNCTDRCPKCGDLLGVDFDPNIQDTYLACKNGHAYYDDKD